jgi:hypothetical protein
MRMIYKGMIIRLTIQQIRSITTLKYNYALGYHGQYFGVHLYRGTQFHIGSSVLKM